MAKLRIFRVPAVTVGVIDQQPKPVELESVTISADGDAAKRAARAFLEEAQYVIRSISWGPAASPGQPAVLIAYVTTKKEGA